MKNTGKFSTLVGQAMFATALLLGSTLVSAATISASPVTQDVFAGDTVVVNIGGTGFDNVTGGGLDITWDPTVLTMSDISGVSLATSPWLAPLSDPGTLSTGSISLLRVGLLAFPTGFTGDAAIATLTFVATDINVPSDTDITIIESVVQGGNWFPKQTPLIFESGTVNVTVNEVPLPAAVWLFGSGLLGLVGVRRRQQQK